jgi:hypothetical protein
MTLHLILLIIFAVCELLAAIGAAVPRVNLTALGLFFFALSLLF